MYFFLIFGKNRQNYKFDEKVTKFRQRTLSFLVGRQKLGYTVYPIPNF